MRNEPDMPRWQISTGPPSRCTIRYLARRPSAVTRLPGERLGETLGEGKAQIRPARLDLDDARALHHRLQPAPDGLDLGQFRHCAAMAE